MMKRLKRKRMKIEQERFPLRVEIERAVCAYATNLKPIVKFMPLTNLLNNVHPWFRERFANELYKLGKLTNEELRQYVKTGY